MLGILRMLAASFLSERLEAQKQQKELVARCGFHSKASEDFLVIETSGLCDPAPVLSTLDHLEALHLDTAPALDSPLEACLRGGYRCGCGGLRRDATVCRGPWPRRYGSAADEAARRWL